MARFRLSAIAAAWTAALTTVSACQGAAADGAPPLKPAGPHEKVLRTFLPTDASTLDPASASDPASLALLENLFDPLLRYAYLARPVKLQPNTLRDMPKLDKDGVTYTFHLRSGVYFTPDPVFKGKRREVTAEDYVYSFKRLYDPALKSPWLFLFEGKLAGDAALKQQFDITTAIPGLQAVDRYTLRIRLNQPDPNFLFHLAMPATSVVAREAAQAYGAQLGHHPIGTGPFRLAAWQRSDKITLLANPGFRDTMFHAGPDTPPETRGYAARLEGKRLPLVQRIEVRVMAAHQSRVTGFLNGEFDYIEQVPESMRELVLADGAPPALKPELARRGMELSPFALQQTSYMWMNMDDPLIGGYGEDKIALRRAIALSYNAPDDIALLKKGLALPAQSPLPPHVRGYDPAYRSPLAYDPALARALLDRFGYKTGKDGFRTLPNGRPLRLTMHSDAGAAGRRRDELWRQSLRAVGLRVRFKSAPKSEIIKASQLGKVMMYETSGSAGVPDGDQYYQLLYGPNSGRTNHARFNLPAYNQHYEQARGMDDTPARRALYRDMNQLIHAYLPWVMLTHPVSADIRQPWLKHYKRHPVEQTNWRYVDIDVAERNRATKR